MNSERIGIINRILGNLDQNNDVDISSYAEPAYNLKSLSSASDNATQEFIIKVENGRKQLLSQRDSFSKEQERLKNALETFDNDHAHVNLTQKQIEKRKEVEESLLTDLPLLLRGVDSRIDLLDKALVQLESHAKELSIQNSNATGTIMSININSENSENNGIEMIDIVE